MEADAHTGYTEPKQDTLRSSLLWDCSAEHFQR